MRRRPLGFGRNCRLRASREIRAVQQGGRRKVAGPLVVLLTPRTEGPARLALAVSRKVGHAVQRNRVKRRVREAFRHLGPRLASVDVVVVARSGAPQTSGLELAQSLESALRALGAFSTGETPSIG